MADNPRRNALGQPVGPDLPGWTARPRPPRTPLEGRFCRIEALDPERHTADLADAFLRDKAGANWTYLSAGPYSTADEIAAYLKTIAPSQDPVFHTIIDLPSGKAVGIAGLMRIDPANGVIEVGHIHYSPLLQRHPAATEAMFLLMRRVFDELGYRRYEWKCDSLNAPSRAAALRLGFLYEGLFRQAVVYKGRSRDTTWFSITDSEWPALKRAYEAWLAPANFDAAGKQKMRLQDAIAAERASG
ncbi:MAG: GNAT family N-acetyltransferase [Hyphomicrobiaceae bacterium]